MRQYIVYLFFLVVSFNSYSQIQQEVSSSEIKPINKRMKALNNYWEDLARTAREGDFDGMKALYHEDAIVVKSDTTFAVSKAFKVRWKKEIMEVKNGKRTNSLDFRFSKRIGSETTAFEKGIYRYTSVETATDKDLGGAYIHFETLLVKVNNRWVAIMEHQKEEATEAEWNSLE